MDEVPPVQSPILRLQCWSETANSIEDLFDWLAGTCDFTFGLIKCTQVAVLRRTGTGFELPHGLVKNHKLRDTPARGPFRCDVLHLPAS